MPKLSPISARELIKILQKQGFLQTRQEGSHARFVHQDGRRTTIPIHSGEKIGIGLLRKIMRDTGISRGDFENLR